MTPAVFSVATRPIPGVFPALRRATVALLLGLTRLSAQTSPAQLSADQAWSAVTILGQSAADFKVTKIKGMVAASRAESIKGRNEREARALKFRAVAQNAREFHTRYPTHPKMAEARKLEALASLDGITPTDKIYERAALATATAFRANPAHPMADRIQVAHAMESVTIARKTLGRPWFANPVLAETMLDRLHAEFGEQPEIWGNFLALAQNTYCDAGNDVAHRIVQSPYAPEPTKAAARRILERHALVRRPLDLPLNPTRGRPTTLAQLAGKTTVVCVWDGTRYPEGPPGLHDFTKNPLPNTKWVYISLGQLGVLPKGKKPTAAPPGTTCVEALGSSGPLAAKLQISQLPYVFVLDDQQRLSGYGRIDEIPALLAGIGRPALP